VARLFSLALLLIATLLGAEGLWIPAKARLAQVLLEDAWQRARDGASRPRPWPWADSWPVARITVPRLGVDLIVLEGASGRNLAFAPGHLDGSAPPGAAGNTIVAGHRDTSFRFLESLERDDLVLVQGRDGPPVRYRVAWIAVMDAADSRAVEEDASSSLTLATCYPFDAVAPGGRLRYVVRAHADGDEPAARPLRYSSAASASAAAARPASSSSFGTAKETRR